MKRQALIDSLIALVVFLLLYASISKLVEFKGFVAAMNRQPLPGWSKSILVWVVPISEILVSLCLLYDNLMPTLAIYLPVPKKWLTDAAKLKVRLAGLYGALLLMASFTVYTGLAVFGAFQHKPCGCGGVINNLTWGGHFALNLAYTMIISAAIWLSKLDKSRNTTLIKALPTY